jgi:hypothetical protein
VDEQHLDDDRRAGLPPVDRNWEGFEEEAAPDAAVGDARTRGDLEARPTPALTRGCLIKKQATWRRGAA